MHARRQGRKDFVGQWQEFVRLQVKFFNLRQIHNFGIVPPERLIQLQLVRKVLNISNRQLLSKRNCNQPLFGVDGVTERLA
jgi:hypothetical protein